MAKYYVRSGKSSLIVSANSAECAAIYMMKRLISSYFPIDDIETRLLHRLATEFVLMGLNEMDRLVFVSQIGFGRSDAGLFRRQELFSKLRSRVEALIILFDQID